jgi:(E)-4-hydroxy-3-methyl-but-2-enyl pyrophosphate reductase
MEIIRAENSGFCFGVRNALEKTLEQIEKKENQGGNYSIYTCGPLIHNPDVIEELEKQGVKVIEDLSIVNPGDTVIIRSHGEPEAFYDELKGKEVDIIDTTCPFVSRIHDLVKDAYDRGEQIIIVGDKNHPEVIATNGWCQNSAFIIGSRKEAELVPEGKYFLVCQTTIQKELLDDVVEGLREGKREIEVRNTICRATSLRQESCGELSKKVDAMIIIGGRSSSNTRKLYKIASEYCKNCLFIENYRDLSLKEVQNYNRIGIAAGASTPESVIKEVIASMSETNEKITMADFMDEIDASLRLPHTGEIVKGKVHEVHDKYIVVNLGCKKDGILPDSEVSLKEGEKLSDLYKPDDDIEAKVVKTDDGDGSILLSKKKLEISKQWAEIREANEDKSLITVKVIRTVRGGVIAEYKDVTGFIPMSQLSDRYIEDATDFIGKVFDVRVTRVETRRNRAVFSRKAVLIDQKKMMQEKIWDTINVGDIVEGTVMRFTDYGAFVDIGGIDGLLHISEISWGKLKHPKDALSIGEKIQVKILALNQEKNKISLGLKQTIPEPWSVITEKYQVGDIVPGKVVQIKDYGAFVELEPGLDGLVHISEVAHRRVSNMNDELTVGRIVHPKILEIDTERRRISLSLKAAADEIGEEAALGKNPEDNEAEAAKTAEDTGEEAVAEIPGTDPVEAQTEASDAIVEEELNDGEALVEAPSEEAPLEEAAEEIAEETSVESESEEEAPAEDEPEEVPSEEKEEDAE